MSFRLDRSEPSVRDCKTDSWRNPIPFPLCSAESLAKSPGESYGDGGRGGRRAGLDKAFGVGYRTFRAKETIMTAVKERRRAGKKGGNGRVVLSRRRYERLLEDLHDLAVVAERRNEPSISLEDIKKRLRKRGRL